MLERSNIQVELIKLISGERLLRLTDLASGLAVEKKIKAEQAVVRQKERLFSVLEAALIRDRSVPA
jgi:hypothetical protein